MAQGDSKALNEPIVKLGLHDPRSLYLEITIALVQIFLTQLSLSFSLFLSLSPSFSLFLSLSLSFSFSLSHSITHTHALTLICTHSRTRTHSQVKSYVPSQVSLSLSQTDGVKSLDTTRKQQVHDSLAHTLKQSHTHSHMHKLPTPYESYRLPFVYITFSGIWC